MGVNLYTLLEKSVVLPEEDCCKQQAVSHHGWLLTMQGGPET